MGSSFAWAQSSVTSETETGPKKWRVTLDASYVPIVDRSKTKYQQKTYTDYLAIGDYFVSKRHRFRISQSWTQFSLKYNSDHEFNPSDTRLFHYYNFESRPLGASYLIRSDLSVPVSNLSNQDGLVTAFTSSLFVTKMFFNNRLFTSVRPLGRYHFYKYRTSPGGRLLPLYTVGVSALASWSFTDKISVLGAAYFSLTGLNSSQYDPDFRQLEQGLYSVSIVPNYQITKEIGIYAAYMSGAAQYVNEGRYEVFLYDPRRSRYGIGMTAIF